VGGREGLAQAWAGDTQRPLPRGNWGKGDSKPLQATRVEATFKTLPGEAGTDFPILQGKVGGGGGDGSKKSPVDQDHPSAREIGKPRLVSSALSGERKRDLLRAFGRLSSNLRNKDRKKSYFTRWGEQTLTPHQPTTRTR